MGSGGGAPEDSSGRSGRGLVIAIGLFALSLGFGGLVARAWVRGLRGDATAAKVLEQLVTDGRLDRELGAEVPVDEARAAFHAARAALGEELSEADQLAAALAAAAAYGRCGVDARAEVWAWLDPLLLRLIAAPAPAARLLDAGPVSLPLRGFAEGEGFRDALESSLHRGLRRLDAFDAEVEASHNPISAVFLTAQSADVRATFARVLGTCLQASRYPYPEAEAAVAKSAQIANYQAPRVSEEELRVFPDMAAAFEVEFRGRSRALMVLYGLAFWKGNEQAPEAIAGLGELTDPFSGEALRYTREDTRRGRLWSVRDAELAVVIDFAR